MSQDQAVVTVLVGALLLLTARSLWRARRRMP